jgi:hypothetical protein
MAFHPGEVDLAVLSRMIAEQLTRRMPQGFLPGKTAMRDIVAAALGCSELEAERIVDTLVSRGLVQFVELEGGSGLDGKWQVVAAA